MRLTILTLVLSLFIGSSQAQFIPEKTFRLPTGQTLASLLAKGDFNHDNKLDVLVSSLNSSNQPALAVFPGTGGGGFGKPIVTEISGANILAIASVGDINGDGIADAVITGTNQITGVSEIGVMLADGTGKFNAPIFFPSTITGTIVVGDFTGDKKADLAVFGTALTVFPGNGNGTFGSPVSSAFGVGAECGAVADFNKDGKLDIIAGSTSNTGGSVLLGNGDGTFQSPLTVIGGFCDVAIGDFNKRWYSGSRHGRGKDQQFWSARISRGRNRQIQDERDLRDG